MDSRWTKGYEGEAKELRKKEVLSYNKGFSELKAILEKEFKGPDHNYDDGWAIRQMAINEYNRVLKDMLKIINHCDN